MTLYRLTWTETLTATVEAESESAARQAWIDGDVDNEVATDNRHDYDLVVVEEDDACPDDPDGVHHVGCGCDYDSPDGP